ncbi:hypothetical protein B0H11DRAFT_2049178, partial [Mycena galericulata]
QCLDVTNGVAASGTLLQTWTCTANDANQQWTVGGASGSITWTGQSFCLDLTKGADVDGTVMQIWGTCTFQHYSTVVLTSESSLYPHNHR